MTKQVTVTLTELQAGEVSHKLAIVRDEPDLLDSYDVTEEEISALCDAVPASGAFTFDAKYAELLIGELENAIDIALDNLERDLSNLSYIRSLRLVVRAIARATTPA